MEYINNEEHPYGENVIVAISRLQWLYVEDSILFNEGSVKRSICEQPILICMKAESPAQSRQF